MMTYPVRSEQLPFRPLLPVMPPMLSDHLQYDPGFQDIFLPKDHNRISFCHPEIMIQ